MRVLWRCEAVGIHENRRFAAGLIGVLIGVEFKQCGSEALFEFM